MYNTEKQIEFHWMWRRHWTDDREGIINMAIELDNANVKSVLLPYGPVGLDLSIFVPEALEKTKNMIMTLALPAYGISPDYAGKLLHSLQTFGKNRIGVNLVAGRWGDEGGGIAEQIVLDHYMLDSTLIDSLEKRVNITSSWMDKFVALVNEHYSNYGYKTHLAVVGSSDITINIANKHTDYIYIDDKILYNNHNDFLKINNAKPILIIDPLIIENNKDIDSVEYDEKAPTRPYHHLIGTYDEIVDKIKEISNKYNIYDFMIHTDQKDISKLLKLVKDFDRKISNNNNELEHFDILPNNNEKDKIQVKLHDKIFERLGNTRQNIKFIKNFISKEECESIIENIKTTEPSSSKPVQFSPNKEPVTYRIDWDRGDFVEKYNSMVFSVIENRYNIKIKNRSAKIAEWTKNDQFDLHINDLGTNEYNNISATIFLNDDYDGGEINFLLHSLKIKPKAGDLLIFPGNKNYEHIIKIVNNGSRYTIPLWYTFTE